MLHRMKDTVTLLLAIISSSHATEIITEKTWAPASVADITACYYPNKKTNLCTLWGEGAFYLTSIAIQPGGPFTDGRVKNFINSKCSSEKCKRGSFRHVFCISSSR